MCEPANWALITSPPGTGDSVQLLSTVIVCGVEQLRLASVIVEKSETQTCTVLVPP